MIKFSNSVQNFPREFCSAFPVREGFFLIDGQETGYLSESDFSSLIVDRYNAGQRVFDVEFLAAKTAAWNKSWDEEKAATAAFFSAISATPAFKRGLKQMLEGD